MASKTQPAPTATATQTGNGEINFYECVMEDKPRGRISTPNPFTDAVAKVITYMDDPRRAIYFPCDADSVKRYTNLLRRAGTAANVSMVIQHDPTTGVLKFRAQPKVSRPRKTEEKPA